MEFERLHEIGNKNCKECCCGTDNCSCGGLIHCEVSDEIETGAEDGWEWVHSYRCDKCDYQLLYENDDFYKIKFR